MSEKKRARSDEAKAQKRAMLIATARQLFAENEFAAITVDSIAAEAKIAKGTFFLYFSTREELFLALAKELFSGFFDDMLAAIVKDDDRSTQALKALLCNSLFHRTELMRMMTLLNVLIEKNVSLEALKDFKLFVHAGLVSIGAAAEKRFPFLAAAGGGTRFFFWLYGIVVGFQNLAQPAACTKLLIDEDELRAFRFDFESEFDCFIGLFLGGISAEKQTKPRPERA